MIKYNWVTIGCGLVAHELAAAFAKDNAKIYGVGSIQVDQAKEFAQKYEIEHVYENLDDIFTDPNVDIVYICTPQIVHMEYIRKALTHGKHVLCEKAMNINVKDCEEGIKLAKENNLVLCEALTLFHMPFYRMLNDYIKQHELGKLNFIQMNFGSYKPYDMKTRFFNKDLAGGALLDIGTYALSFCRWFMSSQPKNIMGQVRLAPSGVDEQCGILLQNDDGEMATLSLSLHSKQPKRGMLSYDKAYIEVYSYPRATRATITYTNGEHGAPTVDEIECGNVKDWLLYEIHDMEMAVDGDTSRVYIDYTRDVMEIISTLKDQFGIKFKGEE